VGVSRDCRFFWSK